MEVIEQKAMQGLSFGFTEAQQAYRKQVRSFAEEVLAPRAKEWDRDRKTPWPVVKEAAERGLFEIPKDYVTRGILVEETGYVDFNCALHFLVSTKPYTLFSLPGVPDEVARPFIDGMAAGEKIIAVCFTEPDSGSDMAAFKTVATRDGDEWVISGVKTSISWADAHAYIVTCKTDSAGSGVWGLSSILVPKETPGVHAPKNFNDMGSRAVARGEVLFEEVRVPSNYLIGEENKAYALIAEFFDTNRAYIGLKCVAAAQASVDETCRYAKRRESMGKTISHYQGISFALAEAETLLEAARLLCYKTLWMTDRSIRHSREGAMIKWWVPEITMEIVRKCLTIHGHYGYTSDLPFEQRLRDILGWQIGDGTAEVSKLLIARGMMGKEFVG